MPATIIYNQAITRLFARKHPQDTPLKIYTLRAFLTAAKCRSTYKRHVKPSTCGLLCCCYYCWGCCWSFHFQVSTQNDIKVLAKAHTRPIPYHSTFCKFALEPIPLVAQLNKDHRLPRKLERHPLPLSTQLPFGDQCRDALLSFF